MNTSLAFHRERWAYAQLSEPISSSQMRRERGTACRSRGVGMSHIFRTRALSITALGQMYS